MLCILYVGVMGVVALPSIRWLLAPLGFGLTLQAAALLGASDVVRWVCASPFVVYMVWYDLEPETTADPETHLTGTSRALPPPHLPRTPAPPSR